MNEGLLYTLFVKFGIIKTDLDNGIQQAQQAVDNFKPPEPAKMELDASDYTDEQEGVLAKAKKALDALISPIKKKLELETKDSFDDRIDDSVKKVSFFQTEAGKMFGDIATQLVSAGVTAVITGFINSVNNLMDLAKNLGKDISDNAKEVGLSTKEYQIWDKVMKRSGNSAKDLSKGVSNVNTYLENLDAEKKPKGFEDLASAFEKLGVQAKDAEGYVRPMESVLNDVIYALASYDGDDKQSLAQKILGNKDFSKFLQNTSADLKALRREADDVILSDEQIESSIRYNDALEKLNASLDNLKETVSLQLLDPLRGIVDAMTEVMNFFNPDSWKDKSTEGMFKDIQSDADKATVDVEATAAQAETLIDKLIELNNKTNQTAEDHQQWATYADWLIEHIPSLETVIDREKGAITGEADALKENVRQWKERQKALIVQQALDDKREVAAQRLHEAIDAQTDVTMAEAEAEGKRTAVINMLNEELQKNSTFQNKFKDMDFKGPTTTDEKGNKLIGSDASFNDLSKLQYTVFHGASDSVNDLYDQTMGEIAGVYKKLPGLQQTLAEKTKAYNDAVNKFNMGADSAQKLVNALDDAIEGLPESKNVEINVIQNGEVPGDTEPNEYKAAGDWIVPYDNFEARLHRGEAILTASQARRYREGSGSSLNMDSLVSGIVGAVQAGMAGATVNSYINGHAVNENMSRDTIRQIKSRRFAK